MLEIQRSKLKLKKRQKNMCFIIIFEAIVFTTKKKIIDNNKLSDNHFIYYK